MDCEYGIANIKYQDLGEDKKVTDSGQALDAVNRAPHAPTRTVIDSHVPMITCPSVAGNGPHPAGSPLAD